MKWFYADAGRQMGPVDEQSLDELARTGVVRDDTLVWHEGMANWASHASVRGAAQRPAMQAVATAGVPGFCSECGRPFPPDQLVTIGNATVCATCKPVYLQRLNEGGVAAGARHYAGFWIRFVARMIDAIILGIVSSLISIPLVMSTSIFPGRSVGLMAGAFGFAYLLNFVINLAYETYFVSAHGGTPGKLLLGLRVIRADGSAVPVGLAAGRYLAEIVSAIILMIGFIMAAFDDQKRALHDRICETRVIHSR